MRTVEDHDPPACHVLLVEDDRADARLIATLIRQCRDNVDVTHCTTLAEANSHAGEIFDVILSDLNLPDSAGSATIAHLAGVFPGLPLIALTSDEYRGTECIAAGAQDFVPKSELDGKHFRRTVEFAIQRNRQFRDTEYDSRHDALTGILNRHAFEELVGRTLAASDVSQSYFFAFVDVDGFKSVNDTFGHQVGDSVLVAVADFLRKHTRSSDVLGRWGGDEFVAFGHTSDGGDPELAARLDSDNIVLAEASDHPAITVRASCGVVHAAGGTSYTELVARADHAMYEAKLARSETTTG